MEHKKRRSSILKRRNSEYMPSPPTITLTRRISFSGKKSVKEFAEGNDNATIWVKSYEESENAQTNIEVLNRPSAETTSKAVIFQSTQDQLNCSLIEKENCGLKIFQNLQQNCADVQKNIEEQNVTVGLKDNYSTLNDMDMDISPCPIQKSSQHKFELRKSVIVKSMPMTRSKAKQLQSLPPKELKQTISDTVDLHETTIKFNNLIDEMEFSDENIKTDATVGNKKTNRKTIIFDDQSKENIDITMGAGQTQMDTNDNKMSFNSFNYFNQTKPLPQSMDLDISIDDNVIRYHEQNKSIFSNKTIQKTTPIICLHEVNDSSGRNSLNLENSKTENDFIDSDPRKKNFISQIIKSTEHISIKKSNEINCLSQTMNVTKPLNNIIDCRQSPILHQQTFMTDQNMDITDPIEVQNDIEERYPLNKTTLFKNLNETMNITKALHIKNDHNSDLLDLETLESHCNNKRKTVHDNQTMNTTNVEPFPVRKDHEKTILLGNEQDVEITMSDGRNFSMQDLTMMDFNPNRRDLLSSTKFIADSTITNHDIFQSMQNKKVNQLTNFNESNMNLSIIDTKIPENRNLFEKILNDSLKVGLLSSPANCTPVIINDSVQTYDQMNMSKLLRPDSVASNTTADLCHLNAEQLYKKSNKKDLPTTKAQESLINNTLNFQDSSIFLKYKKDFMELSFSGDNLHETKLNLVHSITDDEQIVESKVETVTSQSQTYTDSDTITKSIEEPMSSQQQSVQTEATSPRCKKCKNCRMSLSNNESILKRYSLDATCVNSLKLDLSRYDKFKNAATLSNVLQAYENRRREFFSKRDHFIDQNVEAPDVKFLLENRERSLQRSQQDVNNVRMDDIVCPFPYAPMFETLLENKYTSEATNWNYNGMYFTVGKIKFSHKKLTSLTIIMKFSDYEECLQNSGTILFSEIKVTECPIKNKNLKHLNGIAHAELLSKLPTNLSSFCSTSNDLDRFLALMEEYYMKAYNKSRDFYKICILNHTYLYYEESQFYLERNIFNIEARQSLRILVKIDSLDKIGPKDVFLTPCYEFLDKIHSLSLGLEFLRSFLADPFAYIKD